MGVFWYKNMHFFREFTVDAEEAKANEKREAEIVLLQKREDDKVAFLMCQRP